MDKSQRLAHRSSSTGQARLALARGGGTIGAGISAISGGGPRCCVSCWRCRAVALGACAPFHRPLAAADRRKVQEVDVRVVIAQESFMFSAQPPGVSAATGGGLLGALIDSSVQQSRQKDMSAEVQAIVGPLLDYDYRAEAATCAERALAEPSAFPLKIRSVAGARGHAAQGRAGGPHRRHQSGPAYMVLLLQYALEPGLGAFTTRTSALLWQDGRSEPSYRASVIYQTPIGGTARAAVIRRLTANDGQVLRAVMRESIAQTLHLAGHGHRRRPLGRREDRALQRQRLVGHAGRPGLRRASRARAVPRPGRRDVFGAERGAMKKGRPIERSSALCVLGACPALGACGDRERAAVHGLRDRARGPVSERPEARLPRRGGSRAAARCTCRSIEDARSNKANVGNLTVMLPTVHATPRSVQSLRSGDAAAWTRGALQSTSRYGFQPVPSAPPASAGPERRSRPTWRCAWRTRGRST
jgi:hypothetical protein